MLGIPRYPQHSLNKAFRQFQDPSCRYQKYISFEALLKTALLSDGGGVQPNEELSLLCFFVSVSGLELSTMIDIQWEQSAVAVLQVYRDVPEGDGIVNLLCRSFTEYKSFIIL